MKLVISDYTANLNYRRQKYFHKNYIYLYNISGVISYYNRLLSIVYNDIINRFHYDEDN